MTGSTNANSNANHRQPKTSEETMTENQQRALRWLETIGYEPPLIVVNATEHRPAIRILVPGKLGGQLELDVLPDGMLLRPAA
jgi:hypothetical protein